MARIDKFVAEYEIVEAKQMLDLARSEGDQLKIDLREASLNDLLERYSSQVSHISHVLSKGKK